MPQLSSSSGLHQPQASEEQAVGMAKPAPSVLSPTYDPLAEALPGVCRLLYTLYECNMHRRHTGPVSP